MTLPFHLTNKYIFQLIMCRFVWIWTRKKPRNQDAIKIVPIIYLSHNYQIIVNPWKLLLEANVLFLDFNEPIVNNEIKQKNKQFSFFHWSNKCVEILVLWLFVQAHFKTLSNSHLNLFGFIDKFIFLMHKICNFSHNAVYSLINQISI